MYTFRLKQILLSVLCGVSVLSCWVPAATWYVDPVNGSDMYDGTSPFHVPNTPIGPGKTIESIVHQSNQYDILILADGVYSGQFNTSSNVFNMIDTQHLYVTSADGPDNCILQLYEPVSFSAPAYPPENLETHFYELTFTCLTSPPAPGIIAIQNDSRVIFEDCLFSDFHTGTSNGSIIYVHDGAAPELTGCRFTGNRMQTVIYAFGDVHVRIEDCSFTDNQNAVPDWYEPCCMIKGSDNPEITVRKTNFSDNHTVAPFAAISLSTHGTPGAQLMIEECVIENNSSSADTDQACVGIITSGNADIFVMNTRVENLSADHPNPDWQAAGMYAFAPGRLFMFQSQFNHNNTGLSLVLEGPENDLIDIFECEFIGNQANPSGNRNAGGILLDVLYTDTEINFRECVIQQNQVGFFTNERRDHLKTLTFENCLITDNIEGGFAIAPHPDSPVKVTNCTFVNNGMLEIAAGYTHITSSILRNGSHSPIIDYGYNVVNYSNVQGGWTGPGTGNIDVDPLFADPGIWHPDPVQRTPGTDYHLKSTAGRWSEQRQTLEQDDVDSPCIDAGDPAVVSYFEPTGSGGRINMGAYGNTWQASRTDHCTGGVRNFGLLFGDINKDCRVNLADFAAMADDWLQSTLEPTPPIIY